MADCMPSLSMEIFARTSYVCSTQSSVDCIASNRTYATEHSAARSSIAIENAAHIFFPTFQFFIILITDFTVLASFSRLVVGKGEEIVSRTGSPDTERRFIQQRPRIDNHLARCRDTENMAYRVGACRFESRVQGIHTHRSSAQYGIRQDAELTVSISKKYDLWGHCMFSRGKPQRAPQVQYCNETPLPVHDTKNKRRGSRQAAQ